MPGGGGRTWGDPAGAGAATMLDNALNATRRGRPTGKPGPTALLGAQIAERIVALRSADRSDAQATFMCRSRVPASINSRRRSRRRRSCYWGGVAPRSCAAGAVSNSRAAGLHQCGVRARLRRGQEPRRAQQCDADRRPDRGGDLLDGADWCAVVCRRARRVGGEEIVGGGKRQTVRAAVDGDRGFADRGVRRKVQEAALAAGQRDPCRGRPRHRGTEGRPELGAAAGDAAAPTIRRRMRSFPRRRRGRTARLFGSDRSRSASRFRRRRDPQLRRFCDHRGVDNASGAESTSAAPTATAAKSRRIGTIVMRDFPRPDWIVIGCRRSSYPHVRPRPVHR